MQKKVLFFVPLLAVAFMFMGCPNKQDDTVTTTLPEPKTYTLNVECAYKTTVTPNPSCFIDLDKGVVYNIQNAAAYAADIDLVWVYRGYDTQFYLWALNTNSFSVATNGFNAGELGLGNWSVRNNCILDYSGSLAKGAITSAKTAEDLKALIKSKLDFYTGNFTEFDGTSSTFAKVFVFETNNKKRGAFIVNSNSTDSNGGRANITIRVEP